ncbi:MAG: sprT domain-containing protein [Helicobacteraceae bacterium]|nr:sprT domain-containing protein [Helicobacteraceae bacterium]
MFKKKLELVFIFIALSAILFMAKNYYDEYQFKHNPIAQELLDRIYDKEREILTLMQQNYGYKVAFPIEVTDKIPSNLYGVTSSDSKGNIKILLNKKRFKESMDYIVESVLPHEYAHALIFKQGKYRGSDGHSKAWQESCVKLGGVGCAKYVNSNDVIMGKLPF